MAVYAAELVDCEFNSCQEMMMAYSQEDIEYVRNRISQGLEPYLVDDWEQAIIDENLKSCDYPVEEILVTLDSSAGDCVGLDGCFTCPELPNDRQQCVSGNEEAWKRFMRIEKYEEWFDFDLISFEQTGIMSFTVGCNTKPINFLYADDDDDQIRRFEDRAQ